MLKEAPIIRVVKKNAGGTVARAWSLPEARLDWYLDNWALSHNNSRYGRGWPKKSVGLTNGGASQDVDEMCDDGEKAKASIVDQIVADILPKNPAAHASLLNRYGIATVFRFPRGNEAECLARAREYVRTGLELKGYYY